MIRKRQQLKHKLLKTTTIKIDLIIEIKEKIKALNEKYKDSLFYLCIKDFLYFIFLSYYIFVDISNIIIVKKNTNLKII